MNVQAVGIDPGFQFLTIVRSGGFAGMVDRVRIDPSLTAHVERSGGESGRFVLDASHAEDVLHALIRQAGTLPAKSGVAGCDMYQYDIELGWHGTTYHLHCSGLASDEAIHGAISLADTIFNEPTTLRSQPHTDSATHAPNGNPGIVPPWLQNTTPQLYIPGVPEPGPIHIM